MDDRNIPIIFQELKQRLSHVHGLTYTVGPWYIDACKNSVGLSLRIADFNGRMMDVDLAYSESYAAFNDVVLHRKEDEKNLVFIVKSFLNEKKLYYNMNK